MRFVTILQIVDVNLKLKFKFIFNNICIFCFACIKKISRQRGGQVIEESSPTSSDNDETTAAAQEPVRSFLTDVLHN